MLILERAKLSIILNKSLIKAAWFRKHKSICD